MKRLALFLLFFCSSTTFAGTYVVALRPGTALRPSALIPDTEVVEFRTLDAFAAELTDEEAASLRRSRSVRYVEPIVERHALGNLAPAAHTTSRNVSGQTVPFGIDVVGARQLWSITRGDSINVVVVDTGVDYHHPDLAGVYAGGYNAITKNDDPLDDNGHGTHVAGTIAAADNDFGVVGVAPRVRLWAVKVLKADGNGSNDKVIAAIDWIIQKKRALGGDWVVNLSLGSDKASISEEEAFGHAIDEGLIVCAASGNESELGKPAPVGYPAGYRGVLAIGAIDENRSIATFSNQGPELSLVAPGVGVLSTVRLGTASVAAVQTPSGAFGGNGITGSPKGTISGEFVYCGVGQPEEFPASVAGRIAVIRRGDISFNQKARNAKAAGAIAVVVFNNDGSPLNWTLLTDSDPSAATFDWPITIGVTKEDGETLLRDQSATITVTYRDDDYAVFNGTSMATPHAAGVAALVWSLAPSAPAAAVRQALLGAASDLGEVGVDPVYGYGAVDAVSAAKVLAPNMVVPSGRRILRRGK